MLDGSIPFLIAAGVVALMISLANHIVIGYRRPVLTRRAFFASCAAFALAAAAFVLAVVIRSSNVMPI